MLTYINKISRSKFVRNVAIVAVGTAGAQAITMAFYPIITRLYGPENFGLLGTFMAVLAVLTPVAALTYPIAIVLPKSDRDALGLAKLSVCLAVTVTCVLFFLFLLYSDWLAELLSLQRIANFLLLIPIAMLFSAFQQILQQWLIRKKQFKITARVAIFQALTLNSAKAGIGWFLPVGAVLIILATVGNALHVILLWLGMRKQSEAYPKQPNKTYSESKKVSSLKELASRHRDFPIYRAPQVAINALSQSLPVLMLSAFFGPASAGFYVLGKTVMGLPTTLVGKSVGDVFYPRITEAAYNKENLPRLILKATLALAAVGFIPFALVVAFGPWLFSFVFGSEWISAGEYARWLAVWMFFGFLNRPSVVAVAVIQLQSLFLIYESISVVVKVASLCIGFFVFKSDYAAVALYASSGAVLNLTLVFFVFIKSKKHSDILV